MARKPHCHRPESVLESLVVPLHPSPLNYATPTKYVNLLAPLALILGVAGGPAGAAIGIYIDTLVGEPTYAGLVLLITILALTFIFACIVRRRLGRDAPSKYRTVATVSCVMPVVWAWCLYWLGH